MSQNTKEMRNKVESSQLPLDIKETEDYLNIIARTFEATILGKMSRIADRTPKGSRQNGKIDVIRRVEIYISEISPEDFKGKTKEEIKEILEQKITKYLSMILAEKDLYNKEFQAGMQDALSMVGGYYQASILTI